MKNKDQYTAPPKPPDRDKIVSDLRSAPDSDIVFTHVLETPQSSKDNGNSIPEDDNEEKNSSPSRTVVNSTYNQVTRLIQLQDQLQKEPDALGKQYASLDRLGEGVADSIDKLRAAAETISGSGVK